MFKMRSLRGIYISCLALATLLFVGFSAPTASARVFNAYEGPVSYLTPGQELKQIQRQDSKVSRLASKMVGQDKYEDGWQLYAYQVNRLGDHINVMNTDLADLRAESGDVSHAQRREIKSIAPSLTDLADSTSAEMKTIQAHQEDLGQTHMRAYASDLYHLSKQIRQVIRS